MTLRLHQAEDLRAVVVAAVGPAQAAARDRTGTQVDAFDPARIDEDLTPRHGLGQTGNERGIELEGQCHLPGRCKGVGALHRQNEIAVSAQQPVVVDRADTGEAIANGVFRSLFGFDAIAGEGRIVDRPEQVDERDSDRRRTLKRIDHGRNAEVHARLPQVAIPGA